MLIQTVYCNIFHMHKVVKALCYKRSRLRDPMRWVKFFDVPIPSGRTRLLGFQPLTWMSNISRKIMFLENKARPMRKANNLTTLGHKSPCIYLVERSNDEHSSTCLYSVVDYFLFFSFLFVFSFLYNICWMYRYRLQIKREFKTLLASCLDNVGSQPCRPPLPVTGLALLLLFKVSGVDFYPRLQIILHYWVICYCFPIFNILCGDLNRNLHLSMLG
jgi:hypothetical protein